MRRKIFVLGMTLLSIMSICIAIAVYFGREYDKDHLKLEAIFNENKTLFNEVETLTHNKLVNINAEYISIDNPNRKTVDNDGIYVSYLSGQSEHTKDLEELFSEQDEQKIKKILKNGFVYLDIWEDRCEFSEQGFLDCYNVILYTRNEKFTRDEDDEIVKDLGDYWYIYGYR